MQVPFAAISVGELVRKRPARSRIFEQFQISYCCSGDLSLSEACEQHGLDLELIHSLIDKSDCEEVDSALTRVDPDAMDLTELADYIVQMHHSYLHAELPRLDRMTERVYEVHGDREPRLLDVRRAFMVIHNELSSHMLNEEQIVFPMIRQMEQDMREPASFDLSIRTPLQQMEMEHNHADDAVRIIHEATDGYAIPEWACNTYRAMLDGLQKLEEDLHVHLHMENHVLFPKAIQLEQDLAKDDGTKF